MPRLVNFSTVVLSLAILAGSLISFAPRPAGASGSAPVTVVNTPLPVTGTLTANVAGTVNANVTNTPLPIAGNVTGSVDANVTNTVNVTGSVGLADGTTINIANTEPIATRAADAPLEYVQGSKIEYFEGRNFAFFNFDPIPAGKVLIVKHVSFQLYAPTSATSHFQVGAVVNPASLTGTLFHYRICAVEPSVGICAQDFETYMPITPGQNLTIGATLIGGSVGNYILGSYSGYYVPLP